MTLEEYCKETMNIQEDVLRLRIENERLLKETAGLKAQLQKKINTTTISDYPYSALKLEEAKEILQKMLRDIPNRMWYTDETIKQAEQFLKEIEK